MPERDPCGARAIHLRALFCGGLAASTARKGVRAPPVGPIVDFHSSRRPPRYWPNFCGCASRRSLRSLLRCSRKSRLSRTRPLPVPASTASLRSRCDQGRALRAAINPGGVKVGKGLTQLPQVNGCNGDVSPVRKSSVMRCRLSLGIQ